LDYVKFFDPNISTQILYAVLIIQDEHLKRTCKKDGEDWSKYPKEMLKWRGGQKDE